MDNSINENIEKSEFDARDYRRKETKLEVYDWLKDLPEAQQENDLVEVRFKNTRKGYYRNTAHLKLEVGDIVAVEASPGHARFSMPNKHNHHSN